MGANLYPFSVFLRIDYHAFISACTGLQWLLHNHEDASASGLSDLKSAF